MTTYLERWQDAYVGPYGQDAVDVLYHVLDFAADPDQAEALLRDLTVYLEQSISAAAELRSFYSDPKALEILLSVARCSRYGLNLILREPRRFWGIVQEMTFRAVYERDLLLREVRNEVQRFDRYENQVNALLRFYQYHILRVMIGDLQDALNFEATVREISDMAEAIIQCAYELVVEHYRPRYGLPACGFVVFALGKAGGRELNYSSDIDLIFAYDKPGSTSGGRQELDHDAYFKRVGQELIRILDEPKADGRLFRIDMRLRPEGASGELVLPFRATIDYYYTSGRPWERQAMIKARPIAGDHALGERIIEELRPWVYPRQQSLEQFDSAREMRRRIEERADDDNVKTGAGGIRDIEFLVQFFQLVHGGTLEVLRHRSTLPVLRSLGTLGLITREEAELLEEHYIWLREVEHRLQLWEARQLHAVPETRAERLHLARRCGCDPRDPLTDFESRMERCRREVRELADRYYLTTTEYQDALFFICTGEQPSDELVGRILAPVGFHDLAKAVRTLRGLAHEPFFLLSRHRTEQLFLGILPALLKHLAITPDADRALHEFARIVAAVGGRAWFYEQLTERRDLLASVVSMAGWATYLVQAFERFPGLIDDVIEQLGQPSVWNDDELARARSMLSGAEPGSVEQGRHLAYLHARELAQVAWADLHGSPSEQVCADLTRLAAVILRLSLEQAMRAVGRRLGQPIDAQGKPLRFAVIGFGKLGGGEMSYASDMDVMLVVDPGGRCSLRDRDADTFWQRLIQQVTRMLAESHIYEIDLRLRPWGEQGPLAVTLPMLEKYWSEPRDLWERMAMLRCSVVAGDAALGQEALAVIYGAALGQDLPADAASQVREMRSRLEESVQGRDHLKRGPGGYVDIEFIAQYRSLGLAPDQLPPGSNTATCLEILCREGRISDDACGELLESLRLLRRMETRMRLAEGRAVSSIPTDEGGRLAIARQSGYPDIASLDKDLHFAREHARRWFRELVC